MKIAQVVSYGQTVPPQSQNGLEFIVSWLTEELVARGHEVTLFAPQGSQTKAKLVSLLPTEVINDTHKMWQQPVLSQWNTTLAAAMADEFDIIHCHTGTIVTSLPFIKTPVVFTLHHPFEGEYDVWRPYFENPEYQKQMRFIFDQYAKIYNVTISKRQAEQFLYAKDLYFKNYKTIPNGIDVHKFDWGEKPGDYLFYIGYINKDKGADVAVQVARALDMKLILAGNNAGVEDFFNENIKPYLSDKIQYVGPVGFEEKNKLYKNALATLCPFSWHEPFGLVMVESQACGTPVIAFNKGAAPEVIAEGVTGFVVETKEDMIEAVKKVASLDRKAPRAWVEKNFSIKSMVDNYEEYYKEILRT
jgi:glycosyltransferase involved in cell wall biosynthesis